MGNRPSALGAWCAAALSAAGLLGFLLLFVPRMDVYGVILAPVIFAVYQIPAALLYAIWKKRRAETLPKTGKGPDPSEPAGPPPIDPD
ncbi:MAG: hypothetical protein JW843_02990 [Candidatus Aminicenantes bacterium]|nr:hypothetical protein [Candidatus Aminicenantes bacterium]